MHDLATSKAKEIDENPRDRETTEEGVRPGSKEKSRATVRMCAETECKRKKSPYVVKGFSCRIVIGVRGDEGANEHRGWRD